MQIQCTDCEQKIEFGDLPPRFCHQCGGKLVNSPAWANRLDNDADPGGQPAVPHTGATGNPAGSALEADPRQSEDVTVAPRTGPEPGGIPTGVGTILNGYKLLRWLGSGGMGVVWEAEEISSGRRVALKRLSHSIAANSEYVVRFLREAQLAAKISHPRVTFIFGAGQEQGQPYIVMELMPGRTLGDRVEEQGPLKLHLAVDAILDVIDGLIAVHRMGLIHRDVKPSNCFLNADDSVKIGDFGLSKLLTSVDSNLTKSGTFMGTPSFSAPEQIRGRELDERTDVYSVGATLFYLLTGRAPFEGDAMAVSAQITSDTAPSVRSLVPNIPKEASQVVARCLETAPDQRYPDLTSLRQALLPFASHGTSLANIGRRLAGFMFDYTLIKILFVLANVAYVSYVLGTRFQTEPTTDDQLVEGLPRVLLILNVCSWPVTLLYFAVFDGMFGRTPGKKLMGLGVVNHEGESPGFWQGLLRSFALPGCFGLSVLYSISLYQNFTPSDWEQVTEVEYPLWVPSLLLMVVSTTVVFLIPTLTCLSTMLWSPFLRGLHEFISGTRVVRLETDQARLRQIPAARPVSKTTHKMNFGPYQADEILGDLEGGKVYLGHDSQLHRNVWITTTDQGEPPAPARIQLSRVTRQRWLNGGFLENGARWDAYDEIRGNPVLSLVGSDHAVDWNQYRVLLLDIAGELQTALADNTLPKELSLPQVWVDQHCHARLLDQSLVNIVDDASRFQAANPCREGSRAGQAVRLLQELADLIGRTHVLPLSAQEFLRALAAKPQDAGTLTWVIDELKKIRNKTASLNWDTRAGLLAGTLGIEFALYGFLACGFFLLSYFTFGIDEFEWRLGVGLLLSLAAPVAIGAWLRGGLVFRFMEIDVLKHNGRPASRLRCAWRSFVSWLPALLPVGGIMLLAIYLIEILRSVAPGEGTVAHDWMAGDVVIATTLLSIAVLIVGIIYSLRHPERGLQDWLAGTRTLPH